MHDKERFVMNFGIQGDPLRRVRVQQRGGIQEMRDWILAQGVGERLAAVLTHEVMAWPFTAWGQWKANFKTHLAKAQEKLREREKEGNGIAVPADEQHPQPLCEQGGDADPHQDSGGSPGLHPPVQDEGGGVL